MWELFKILGWLDKLHCSLPRTVPTILASIGMLSDQLNCVCEINISQNMNELIKSHNE